MSTCRSPTDEDSSKLGNLAKNLMIKTFDNYLEKKGYKLSATIGHGSYAKVKFDI